MPNEISDMVVIRVFFQDKLVKEYPLPLPNPESFTTIAGWLGLPGKRIELPKHKWVNGKREPRRWKLELRLESPVDQELLDKIQLADQDSDINISLSDSGAPAEQHSLVGTEAGDEVPISIDGKPKMGKDKEADESNPLTASETSAGESKILQEPKMGEAKITDGNQGESARETKDAKPRVEIMMADDMLEKAKKHAASSGQEVGGVLVGRHIEPKSEDGIYSVEIWNAIPGKDLVSRGASVTFTADTWSTAIREIEKEYGEDLYMVGWYHTHPGFGIFMSGYDRFIHEHYFNEPWQIALVIDPIARKEGFFAWHTNEDKGQMLEDYRGHIEFLKPPWHPSSKSESKDWPAQNMPDSQGITKKETRERISLPTHLIPEKEKSKEESESPTTEPVAANAQMPESQAQPSEAPSKPAVADDRSSQDSTVHSEDKVQQQNEKPASEDPRSESVLTSRDEKVPPIR